jgi:hypothetical protein
MKEVMMNFKIRVVDNIGEWSVESFGVPGTEFHIVDGRFTDLSNLHWENIFCPYNNIEVINKFFSEDDEWQTVFELVEEESNDKE